MEHMIYHLADKNSKIGNFLPMNTDIKELQKNVQDVIKTRKSKKVIILILPVFFVLLFVNCKKNFVVEIIVSFSNSKMLVYKPSGL